MSAVKGVTQIINKLTVDEWVEKRRQQLAERAAKERDLIESLRANLYDAQEDTTTAMRLPLISKSYIEAAIAKLNVALDCAKALDRE